MLARRIWRASGAVASDGRVAVEHAVRAGPVGSDPAAASWFGVCCSAPEESSRPSSSTSIPSAASSSASIGSGAKASPSPPETASEPCGTLGASPTPIVYRHGLPAVPAGHSASSPHAGRNAATHRAASLDPNERVCEVVRRTKGRCNEGLVSLSRAPETGLREGFAGQPGDRQQGEGDWEPHGADLPRVLAAQVRRGPRQCQCSTEHEGRGCSCQALRSSTYSSVCSCVSSDSSSPPRP